MARRATRSIVPSVTVVVVAVAFSIALLVGWTLLVVDTMKTIGTSWLLVLGVVSIVYIMGALMLSGFGLAREILEGRRQRTFIDSVTHELKSPLASLGLCLETLARPELSPPQRDELRAMMRADVERLSSFIDDVLAASRLAHRPPAPARVVIRVRELVERALTRVRARHPDGVDDALTIDVPEDLVVRSDVTSLETILKNLIDNALKYSDPPRTVTITATAAGGKVAISVADRGIGIDRASAQHVFRRFFRGEGADVRARSGTGLGLYVAAELATALGGTLEAKSPGRDQGTTVVLTIAGGAADPAAAIARGEA